MFGDGRFTVKRPAGEIEIRPAEGGPMIVRDTLQCAHCMKHWVVVPGSGRLRGWCRLCNKPLCGAKDCMERCAPFEAKVVGEKPW